jgi:hypothetical protein
VSRKIKNTKDLTTNELIYFKSRAQAILMGDGTTVATSGSYNDLSNKSTPSAVTESTVTGYLFVTIQINYAIHSKSTSS